MAQRRQEERARKAELNRLDNEECGEDEEEEEDMTDDSEEEEVRMFVCFLLLWTSYLHIYLCVFTSNTIFPFTRVWMNYWEVMKVQQRRRRRAVWPRVSGALLLQH